MLTVLEVRHAHDDGVRQDEPHDDVVEGRLVGQRADARKPEPQEAPRVFELNRAAH